MSLRLADGDGAPGHLPVMLAEVLATLAPRDGGVYLDGTFGGGGYAGAILERASCTLWAIDRDPEAIARGASLVARYPGRLHLLHGPFGDMVALLDQAGVRALDGVVLDLGVSSFQLDDPERGFSFRHDGKLDMRMGKHGTSAADLVNALPEQALADVLFEFGEERASRRIAKAIVAARTEAPIETTLPARADKDELVPVNLQAAVTEIGTLELRCLEKSGAGRWKLELNVRMKE